MIRWFEESGDQWQASAEALRARSASQVHNLLEPPPQPRRSSTSSCAATSCSISTPRSGALAFERLASALAPDGALMLGAGETVIGQTDRFVCRPRLPRPLSPRRRTAASADAPRVA